MNMNKSFDVLYYHLEWAAGVWWLEFFLFPRARAEARARARAHELTMNDDPSSPIHREREIESVGRCIETETAAFWQRAMSMRDIRSSGDSRFYYVALLWDTVGPIHDSSSSSSSSWIVSHPQFQYCSSDYIAVSHVGNKIKSPRKRNNEARNCSEVWSWSWHCSPIIPGWIQGRCWGECVFCTHCFSKFRQYSSQSWYNVVEIETRSHFFCFCMHTYSQ